MVHVSGSIVAMGIHAIVEGFPEDDAFFEGVLIAENLTTEARGRGRGIFEGVSIFEGIDPLVGIITKAISDTDAVELAFGILDEGAGFEAEFGWFVGGFGSGEGMFSRGMSHGILFGVR